ncbi:LssY C-terminal domain-containing protein [uncultured Leifsonia sp.]|uniref:LssY C-terminal domain-containing protein n=1 Tax=uncultured Leifsonia sp. TaxID=340359 RepID=UPI0028D78555|nr:LssY C-terminal domain-containing protein [uncultured Leifsonia sp.]
MAGTTESTQPPGDANAGGAHPAAPTPAPASPETAPASPPPSPPPKTWSATGRRVSVNAVVDYAFFVFGGVAAIWLAWIVLTESFGWGWFLLLFFALFWLVLAYLVLPRLHRILTQIYVPDYFIGRARTSDGLLGDPVNLAVLGTEAQLNEAMCAAGWTRADDVTLASSRRIVTSTLLRRSYDEAPVSPLFLFGHQQDVAYQQEVLGNPAKRHHVRFWRCPDGWLLPGGHRVDWLAAGTFDRSVGFSLFTLQITHKIDANTDIERDHIVSTLTSAGVGVEVSVLKDFSSGYHSRNGGGDSIETDGDLPVVDLTQVTVEPRAVAVAADAEARRIARAERRPLPTALGALLMLLRIAAGTLTVVLTVLSWPQVIQAEFAASGTSLTPDERQIADLVFGIAMGVFAAGLVFYFLLALLVFTGSNWARIASMSYSALLIVIAAIDFFNGGPQVTLHANILGLPLDILVVLALSSQASRQWARRPRPHGKGAASVALAAAAEQQALAEARRPSDRTTTR